jgi:ribosomal protein S12 methylthiotransferase
VNCAFCTIPTFKGRHRSKQAERIVAEARELVAQGVKEVVLIGQDTTDYGRDQGAPDSLPRLLSAICRRTDERLRWVRLMYAYPGAVTDRLIETMVQHPQICHYLDIPLQHASARVLDAMGRTGSAAQHLALVERVRSALPDVTLRTTMIAGFPGETEDEIAEAERFLADAAFDFVGVFVYSPEDGTPAAELPGQLPDDVRAERAQRLRDVADDAGFARAAALVGTVQRVLVEGEDEGELVGRTCGQAPDVDGITVLESPAPVDTFVDVRIIDAAGYDLIGAAL